MLTWREWLMRCASSSYRRTDPEFDFGHRAANTGRSPCTETAEATTEAAKYKSERHGLAPLVDPDYPSNDALIFMLQLTEMVSLWTGTAGSSL
jgi:hypothetical protein